MKPLLILATIAFLILIIVFNSSAQQPTDLSNHNLQMETSDDEIVSQTGSGYHLRSETISNGSSDAAGSSYQLQGTMGQPNVGAMQGGNYRLTSGFWHPLDAGESRIYLPLIVR